MPPLPKARLAAWLLTGLLLQACFHLREPANPSGAGDFLPPTDPNILINNFRTATLKLNPADYERSLDKTAYRFTPAPTSSGNNTGIFQRWTWVEEVEWLKNARAKSPQTGQNSLTFIDPRTNYINADTAEWNARYTLNLFHQDTSYRTYTFQGQMILRLTRDTQNNWAIRAWQDARTDATKPCWTDAKQHFIGR